MIKDAILKDFRKQNMKSAKKKMKRNKFEECYYFFFMCYFHFALENAFFWGDEIVNNKILSLRWPVKPKRGHI